MLAELAGTKEPQLRHHEVYHEESHEENHATNWFRETPVHA
jgi:hypothetical protein